MTTITNAEKQRLIDMSVVLSRELGENPALLEKIGINEKRIQKIVKEAKEICQRKNEN